MHFVSFNLFIFIMRNFITVYTVSSIEKQKLSRQCRFFA
nr:MAG TPA: hypothetical protein [Caudoviricetes sp.]